MLKKYEIDYKPHREEEESSYISVKITEEVEENISFGDQIGIFREINSLEFDEDLDLDDKDIQDFIKDNFKNPKSVSGFIKRMA